MSDRHVDHRPTKEVFTHPMSATEFTQNSNGHYGARVDHNGDLATILLRVPHDFAAVEELVAVVIPNAGLPAMNFRVLASYGRKNELSGGIGATVDYAFSSATNRIQEVDIKLSVAGGTRILRAGDYLGMLISRNAAIVGVNTDLWLLGVRLKYKYQ